MENELDVFISYAHIDNAPLPGTAEGWVSVFEKALQQLLSRFKGSTARIWRDPKLDGNELLWPEIEARIAAAAVLVSVFSPRYVSSRSCTEEIEGFCRLADRQGGLVVDNSARLFKVIKTPFEGERNLPPVVGQLLGYQFFRLDAEETPQELDPQFGQDAREEFLRKVNKVAWDIKRLLDRLKQSSTRDADAKPVVYLAECSRDCRDARESIEMELKRLGHVVLPDRQLPTDEADYLAAVNGLLERCAFSIHLIGSGYGLIPDGSGQKSVVVLQNERAAAKLGGGGIRRVIWLPASLRSDQPLQQAFIDALHNDAQAQAGADLLTGDIEALKTAVRAHLKRVEQRSAPPPAAATAGPRKVFLICEARDRPAVVPIFKALRSRGWEVVLPLFTGEAAQVREAFQEQAASANAVFFYYGAGDEAWKYYQLNELHKARASQPGTATEVVWVAPPETDDKAMLLMVGDGNVIDGQGGFSDTALEALLGAWRTAGVAL